MHAGVERDQERLQKSKHRQLRGPDSVLGPLPPASPPVLIAESPSKGAPSQPQS